MSNALIDWNKALKVERTKRQRRTERWMRPSGEALSNLALDPTRTLCPASAGPKPRVQPRKTLFQRCDIFWVRRLKLAQIHFIDVRNLSGLDSLEKTYQPVSLLMPIFRAHERLQGCEQKPGIR